MNKYKALVFDCDGTVLDTAADLVSSVNHILEKYHYPQKSKAETLKILGHGLQYLMSNALPPEVVESRKLEIIAEFKEYYFSHCLIETKPYEGILPLLDKLKAAGYQLALVSNKNKVALGQLNELYFTKYMESVIGESDELAKKPAPDMVYKALEEMGCTKEEALYIGDSEVDKNTADNSGLDCMLVTWGFRSREEVVAQKAKYLADTPEEIGKILL